MKIAGSGSESASGSGSISQRHGSADPDPPQNVMDPQHCGIGFFRISDPGSQIHIFESLLTIFWVKSSIIL
jgi:hypothetical protein